MLRCAVLNSIPRRLKRTAVPRHQQGAIAHRLLHAAEFRPFADCKGTDDPVTANDQPAVEAFCGIGPHDGPHVAALIELLDIAHAEHVGADDFQLGGGTEPL